MIFALLLYVYASHLFVVLVKRVEMLARIVYKDVWKSHPKGRAWCEVCNAQQKEFPSTTSGETSYIAINQTIQDIVRRLMLIEVL